MSLINKNIEGHNMYDDTLDFIIEAEKVRKMTIDGMKKEASEKASSEKIRLEKEKEYTKSFSTVDYLLDSRGER
jgi:hypothetical protein